ncbi:nucleotidyltransferase domain-containing protein [bacterium]|nr:nucleotidyltransferase domain-containing protein [bacterium]
MTNIVDDIVFQIAKHFNRIFPDVKEFYVFGASVDGQLHEDEDIEIAVVFDVEDKSKREQIWPVIGKIETKFDTTIELYPYTTETLKNDEEIYNEILSSSIAYNSMGVKINN